MFIGGAPCHVPVTPVPVADATGAGDIFAAAFLVALREGAAPTEAAAFANAAASLSVQGFGVQHIPSRREVEELLRGTRNPGGHSVP